MGIIHDHTGALKPLTQKEADVYREIKDLGTQLLPIQLVPGKSGPGKPNDWKCRAGGRYLYICEDGLVHYCSQQAAIRASRLRSTRSKMSPANTRPQRPVLPPVRWVAS
jgi:hypothetical protein